MLSKQSLHIAHEAAKSSQQISSGFCLTYSKLVYCYRVHHLPDIIKGDMDSVRSDVREFYSGHGVPIVDLSDDQDTTDLTKCIMFLEKHIFARQRQSAADANIEQEEEQQHGGSNCNGAAPGPQSSADAVHTRGLDHCILVLGKLIPAVPELYLLTMTRGTILHWYRPLAPVAATFA